MPFGNIKTKTNNIEITENEMLLRTGLQKMILEKYKSVSSFSSKNGFDKSDLSKFLKGTKDWQLNKFCRLLTVLKSEVTIYEEENTDKSLYRNKISLQFDPEFWQKFMKNLQKNANGGNTKK